MIGLAPASTASEVKVTSGVIPGTLYAFRVRAMNIFGWGHYSLVTYIQAAQQQAVPLAPTTTIDAATGGTIDAEGACVLRPSCLMEIYKIKFVTRYQIMYLR